MDNYKVKAIRKFNDYAGKDINNPENPFVARAIGDEFNCSAERYLFLKENGAVELVEIEKVEVLEEAREETTKETKPKTTTKKKVAKKK